ncbi:MAG: hypothetical protein LBU09_03700 [Endomicrobium sp.]|jgi:hypothetical protein|nr:hypothetical protein [Endomicrobium sp.]
MSISLKKVFAVACAAAFVYSSIAGDFAYAALNVEETVLNLNPPEISSDDTFKNYAKLTSSADFGGDTLVLNIQDLHMEPSVQKNISCVIDALVKEYGAKNVYVEGGYGKINTSALSKIKDKDAKILNALLEDGLITGTEYYAALNDKDGFLIGLEDEKIHKENIVRLGTLIEKRGFFENKIKNLRKDLSFIQQKYFNAKNIKLEELVESHRNGNISSSKYYKRLINIRGKNSAQSLGRYGATMPFDLNEYPNVCLFLYVDKLGSAINYSKANSELTKLISRLKEDISYADYKDLLARTDNFQNSYLLFAELDAMPKEFKDKYLTPELAKLAHIQTKLRQINPVELISEERFLVEDIRVALSLNKTELEVSFLSDFFLYFEDYLKASISAADYEYLEKKFDKFLGLWDKYAFYNQISDLKEDFKLLKEYYEANDKRNEIFLSVVSQEAAIENRNSLKQIFNEPLSKLLDGKKNIVIAVTGGYHTKGLADLLNAKRISYAVVTPNTSGGVKEAYENYENAASQQAKIFSQTLQLSLFAQILSYSINSDRPSFEAAQSLFKSSAKTLSGAQYGEENIAFLINSLNEAVGQSYKYVFNPQNGTVSLQSADGKYSEEFIGISKSSDGTISISDLYSKNELKDKVFLKDYGKLVSKEEMQKLAENMKTVLKLSTLDLGVDAFLPKVYASAMSIFQWAADKGIYLDISALNGISYNMERYGVADEVLPQNPQIAKMPQAIQDAFVRSYFKQALNSGEPLLAAAMLLFSEFLPIKQDFLEILEAYPKAQALKIIEQTRDLADGKRLDYGAETDINKPGTAGVRGAVGDRVLGIDLASAQIIAQAQADLYLEDINAGKMERRPVAIVSDTRYGGQEFVKAVAGVFIANGFEVEIFDSAVPTPAISFYTKDKLQQS